MTTIGDVARSGRQLIVLRYAMPGGWPIERLDVTAYAQAAEPTDEVELTRDDVAELRERVEWLLHETIKAPMGSGRGRSTRKATFPRQLVEATLASIDGHLAAPGT